MMFAIATPSILPAQAVLALAQRSAGGGAQTEPRVTVRFDKASLRDAVREIVTQSGVEVMYSTLQLPAGAKVTYRGVNVLAVDALKAVLQEAALRVVPLSDGMLRIEPVGGQARVVRQGTITGKVINAKTKQPIAGARIYLNSAQESITTGADGTFQLAVPAGEHTVRIRSVGFTRQDKHLTVGEGAVVTIEIALEPSASVLDEVIVTGTVVTTARKEIPTPITVIHGEELERRGITRIDELFRGEVPGLLVLDPGTGAYSTDSEGLGVTSTIYARGSASLDGSANPIKTYVDGVELLDPSYLGTIDPRSIERIEIVTGPQAATIYGSGAMGGVMQIFTKKGERSLAPEFRLNIRYGVLQNSFSDGRTPEHHDALFLDGRAGPELAYSGSVSYDYTGQWQPNFFRRGYGASMGTTSTRGRLSASASFSATVTRQGTYNSGNGQQDYGLLVLMTGPEALQAGVPFAARMTSGRVSTSSNQTMSLNVDYRATARWQHHATIGRSQNVMALTPIAPDFSRIEDTLFRVNQTRGQRVTWNYHTSYISAIRWISSSLALGTNGSAADQLRAAGCQVTAVSATIVGCTASSTSSVSLPLNDRSWGMFANWKLGMFRQLYTTFGLRLEQNPSYGQRVKFDFTPTNGLTYTLELGEVSLKLMGSYGRATRAPNPDQRLEEIGVLTGFDVAQYIKRFANPDLRPEYSRGPQGGFELYVGNLGSLTLNHYQQTVTDLIQNAIIDSLLSIRQSDMREVWQPQHQFLNIAKVRQFGWEGTASINMGPLAVRGAYSWSDSRVLSVHPHQTTLFRPGASFQNLPTHTGSMMLAYAQGQTNISLTSNFIGASIKQGTSQHYYSVWYGRMPGHPDIASKHVTGLFRERRVPRYIRSNLSGTHRLTQQLAISLNVVNLANNFRSDASDLSPTLGRQTTFGLTYRFSK